MRYVVLLFGIIPLILLAATSIAPRGLDAQEPQRALGVAVTQLVVPEAVDGDIVVFDPRQGLYRLALTGDGATGVGIVVLDPVLLLRTEVAETPVADTGLATVNVVATNGAIGSGDAIAPSAVPGKGEKARPHASYIIGFSREAFIPSAEDERGRINVELSPGPGVPGEEDKIQLGTDLVIGSGTARPLFGFVPGTAAAFARFLLAALFAAGAFVIAYRLYTKNLVAGIASIGRNPLAQSSIRTMMAANIAVIVLVTLAGLMVSALIIAL